MSFAEAKAPSRWFWSTGSAWGTLVQSEDASGARSAQLDVAYGSVRVDRVVIGGSALYAKDPGVLVAGTSYDLAREA
jgi:hypothetical protein